MSKRFCSDGALGGLLRSLFLAAARHSFWVSATHIPGRLNSIADALSRLQMQRFHTLAPLASPVPTPLPEQLLQSQQRVTQFLNVSLAPSTRQSYLSGQRHFTQFCIAHSLLHPSGCPFPVSESYAGDVRGAPGLVSVLRHHKELLVRRSFIAN